MNKTILVAFFIGLFILQATSVQAQGTYFDSIFHRLKTLDLDSIPSNGTTFYSIGYKNRALELSEFYDQALQLFEDSLGVKLNMHIAVLDVSDWDFISSLPYGLPYAIGNSPNYMAFIAAEPSKDPFRIQGDSTQLSEEILLQMHDLGVGLGYIREHQGEIIGVHEIGHGIADQMGIWSEVSWLNELIANYFQIAFLKYRHPEVYERWRLFRKIRVYQRRDNPYKPKYTSLLDFEELYIEMGIPNYGWYQGQFEIMATDIFPEFGFSFIKTIKEKELHKEKDTKDLINKLEQEFLGFVDWEKRLGNGN